jgi:hypothetical protein
MEARFSTETHMTTAALSLDRSSFLRRVLFVDAATCVGTGALLALGAGPLSPLLGLPAALLFYAGLSLFPIAALMAYIGARPTAAGAWFIIAGNAAWVLGSIAVLFLFSPTALGLAFVIAQAAAVALLAELEYVGVRKLS